VDFKDYASMSEYVTMNRDEAGVVTLELHSPDGETLRWNGEVHEQLGALFAAVGADFDNQVVILTGRGDSFIGSIDFGGVSRVGPGSYSRILRAGRDLISGLLSIDVPMIAAVNGPARVHAELAVLCDIVIGSPDCLFQDGPHFPKGIVPGDGVHVIWPMILGPNRSRYFLLMGQEIHAQEALQTGIISEIVDTARLLDRAAEIAGILLEKPKRVRRYTRQLLTQPIKEQVQRDLLLGLGFEGLGALETWPGDEDVLPN
jgi:enoyl-CoA hydratase/carnithine racemase